jgi:hypothetical protein
MRQRTFLAAVLLIVGACGDEDPVGTGWVWSLRAAQARWERSGIESYEITVRRLCFCGFVEPVRVRVIDGIIVSRTVVPSGEPVPHTHAAYIPDVPGLFAIVEEAAVGADELDVTFDAVYGFPTEISIDGDETAVDDEVVFRTEAFTVIR